MIMPTQEKKELRVGSIVKWISSPLSSGIILEFNSYDSVEGCTVYWFDLRRKSTFCPADRLELILQ